MNAAITVIKEQVKNFYLIKRLSLYEMKNRNQSNYLGMAWELINPAIQILIYWFVFGALRDRADVPVAPGVESSFLFWLLAGFIVWIFVFKSTIDGSKSIYSRLKLLSKMNFPMSIIPNLVIFTRFYIHLLLLGIVIIIFQFAGYFVNIYYLQLIYFIFSTYCFIFALSLIISTLSTIIRDVHQFLSSTLRMGLYFSGVLWPFTILDKFPDFVAEIMKLNPIYYLIEGYRAALYGTEWYFITNWEYTLLFWTLTSILFIIGSKIHLKFRRYFIDFI